MSSSINDYQAQKDLPDAIKQLALGFIFLTLVGEAHFSAVLANANSLSMKGMAHPPQITPSSERGTQPSDPPPPKPPPDLE